MLLRCCAAAAVRILLFCALLLRCGSVDLARRRLCKLLLQ